MAAGSGQGLPEGNCAFIAHSGFSLTEILIVIGIMVLLLAMAVPAFNLITGSKSQDLAVNSISSMLAVARNDAIAKGETRGVMFFLDPTIDRYVGLLVQPAQFSSWTGNTSYQSGDYVADPNTSPLRYFLCINPVANNTPPKSNAASWIPVDQYAIDLVPDADGITLPTGVGIQMINDATLDNAGNRTSDGYVRCGAIMFDSAGRLIHSRISIYTVVDTDPASTNPPSPIGAGQLGHRMGLNTVYTGGPAIGFPNSFPMVASPTASPNVLTTEFGLVLYDRQLFATAAGTDDFHNNDAVGPAGTFKDYSFPSLTPIASYGAPNTAGTEWAEEDWLDKNALPVMVNRYNGTLIKGE
ncbi:MAG TPA: prepilin-type N-terminal cleavage/methylation domain-containing protein [Tepidisphaeraceae bacterium]|nr:prepilin-type N-terminal cleavage/methylation domain-containing protein [Tepidisphaeraceae bacterium]